MRGVRLATPMRLCLVSRAGRKDFLESGLAGRDELATFACPNIRRLADAVRGLQRRHDVVNDFEDALLPVLYLLELLLGFLPARRWQLDRS